MNKILYAIIGLVAFGLTACNEDDNRPSQVDSTIMLRANVSSIDVTRGVADGEIFEGKSADGMTAEVWFSNERGKFVKNDTPESPTFIPYHTTVTYSDETPMPVYVDPETQAQPLSYPIGATAHDVFCVGMYPAASWSVTDDGRKAFHPIDGLKDIMFADQIKGTWDVPFTAQQYRHLLTWIKIEASITKVEAAAQWGDITSIKVLNPHNQVDITFATDQSASAVTYSGPETYIPVVEDTNIPLSVVVSNVGSFLCTPSPTITLVITTEKMGERTVEVQLKDANKNALTSYTQAIGKLFIINLYFSALDDIDAVCHLVPWNEQNIDLIGK